VKFAPVHLSAPLGDRGSQTFLRHFDGCPRSGFLYTLYKGEASSVAMVRGVAVHEILERCVKACLSTGEVSIPPEVAKAIVDEVLAEQHVPLREHDYIRESVYRWASQTVIDPAAVIACETLIVLDVDGFQVRMKVDYAEVLEAGAAVRVVDYKSGQGMPSQEDVARKRVTPLAGGGVAGALMAKSFQLVLYALGMRYGQPVRIEPCGMCGAESYESTLDDEIVACRNCGAETARARVEILEPFPLAQSAQRFDLEYVFPGIEDREGRMGKRSMSLTPAELDAYLQSLRGLVARVRHAESSGDWPAQISDAACGECPAASLCPIPRELRDHRGEINTDAEASEAAEVLDREKAEHAARQREIKAHAKANGGRLRFGRDKVQEFVPVTRRKTDLDGLLLAVDRAVQFGEPFEKSDYVKESVGTEFKVRTLTADELAAEAAEGDGDGNRTLDERFGADAPF